MAMKSNFQNVIYDPKYLRFWVNNDESRTVGAHRQPYTFFDFGSALLQYQEELERRKGTKLVLAPQSNQSSQ